MKKIITILLLAASVHVAAQNEMHIVWDASARSTVFERGCYARMIRLNDGRLMAVCEHDGIDMAVSADNGVSWSTPRKIAGNKNNTHQCVPDLIQLSDNAIIVAYNPRPSEPYTPDRKFGIRCRRSTDGGATWSNEIFVNDAHHTFDDGCWEPSMLELPDGELQLYFADEGPYTSSKEQQISLCRSFDGGLTWHKPERVSFRAGFRDGMPVPALLDGGKTIVVAIEDNGFEGINDFFPATVRCDISQNWHDYYVDAENNNRMRALDPAAEPQATGGAPYLRVMPCGATVLSWQSAHDNDGKLTMYVAVGDEHARNFNNITVPFAAMTKDPVMWNSLAVLGYDSVAAVGGYDGKIEMLKGRLVKKP